MSTTSHIVFMFTSYWVPMIYDVDDLEAAKKRARELKTDGHPTKVENAHGAVVFHSDEDQGEVK